MKPKLNKWVVLQRERKVSMNKSCRSLIRNPSKIVPDRIRSVGLNYTLECDQQRVKNWKIDVN